MSHKIAAIADFVANQNTEALVFPEYSKIPAGFVAFLNAGISLKM